MKWIIRLTFAAAVVALGCALCGVQVEQGSAVIVSRFGDPRRTLTEPGLYWKLPTPIDESVRVDTRVHVLDPEPAEYLTGDKKNVIVDAFLAWRVVDPRRFHVSVRDRKGAELRLTDMIRSVLGDVLGSHPFTDLIAVADEGTRLAEVTAEIDAQAIERVARGELGVEIVAARLKRLNFPVQNRSAVFRRMEAEREATAAAFRSEGVEQYEKIKAETDREEAELLAKAEREAAEIRGDADAQATRIYADAVGRDPELYQFLQALEVADEVLGEKTTLILPADHFLLRVLSGPHPGGADEDDR